MTAHLKLKVRPLRGNQLKTRFIVLGSLLAVSCSLGSRVVAEEYGPTASDNARSGSGDALQEIVVTAQKREEKLKDVPISIVAVSAQELADRQITSLREDLPYAVPDLSLCQRRRNSHYLPEIRGIRNEHRRSEARADRHLHR